MTPIHRSLALALVLAAPLSAQPSGAPYTVEETGRGYARLQDAVTAIGSGDGTIRIAPGTYRDCAVQTGGRIAYAAITAGTAIFDGTHGWFWRNRSNSDVTITLKTKGEYLSVKRVI